MLIGIEHLRFSHIPERITLVNDIRSIIAMSKIGKVFGAPMNFLETPSKIYLPEIYTPIGDERLQFLDFCLDDNDAESSIWVKLCIYLEGGEEPKREKDKEKKIFFVPIDRIGVNYEFTEINLHMKFMYSLTLFQNVMNHYTKNLSINYRKIMGV